MKRAGINQSDEYQMKKSLRKTPGAPKSYAQPDEELEGVKEEVKERERQSPKQSIFQHKNWTLKQKIRLMVFLSFYQNLSDWYSERKSIYLYKNLSHFIRGKRTPEQCKNMHSLLKRKFVTIPEIVFNIQLELEKKEDYKRLLLKYQKEIEVFEKEHCIKDSAQRDDYLPLSFRRNTEKEEEKGKHRDQGQRGYKDNRMREGQLLIEKKVQLPVQFQERREQLLSLCNHHFKQWLMCSQILEKRRECQQQQ